MIEYLGWAATAVFVASYVCARANMLRRVQMAGALMWVTYGLAINAYPVVVANLLVFGAAWATARRQSGAPMLVLGHGRSVCGTSNTIIPAAVHRDNVGASSASASPSR